MKGFAFQSTGDSEEDNKILQDFQLTDMLIGEGLCPNGHGILVDDGPRDQHCQVCGFAYSRRTLYL